MKTKEIINGSGRIENETADDKETTMKTTMLIGGIISSMEYDENDVVVGKIRGVKSTVDDIVYRCNNKNNKFAASMGKVNLDDYRYFGRRSMVDNDGYLIYDQHYCNCGGTTTNNNNNANKKKTSSTRTSKNPSANFYEIDKLMYNEIFEMDKNGIAIAAAAATSAVYATKKSLMLNEFLELNDDRTTVQHYYVNDPATAFVNKFVTSAGSNTVGKCRGTGNGSRGASSVTAANSPSSVVESSSCNAVDRADGNLGPSSSLPSNGAPGKGCGVNRSPSQSLCLTSSALLSDKRLVGLFRSVALYWFFCLNTVLAKGDHVFKRKASATAVSPLHDGMNELLHHKNLSSADNLQLKICCPDVVLAVGGVARFKNDDFLWQWTAEEAESTTDGYLLSWAEHSKSKLFNDLFEKVLRDLADNCGIFTTNAAAKTSTNELISFSNHAEKMIESRKPVETKNNGQERLNQTASPKKSNRSGVSAKKVTAVRRKYIVDVLDYYYEDEGGDDDAEDDGDDTLATNRAPKATATVVNRIIWKKRAVKNKQKSKRKLGRTGGEQHQQQRVQQIIIECYGGGGCAYNGDYVINDGYEEVVGASEAPPKAAAAPAVPAVVVDDDDEMFLDFDSYAESLKREVTLRQLRKRKQPTASHQPAASKLAPPPTLKRAESSTEDELSGAGSTSSSLLLELEESSSYFLPDGRFHSATQKYPKYDLWCSPLVMEKVWPVGEAPPVPSAQPAQCSRNQTSGGPGRIFKNVKTASTTAKAAGPAQAPSFKPYRLWESSWAPEDDFIPSFVAARRHCKSPKFASMATMTGVGVGIGATIPPPAKTTAARRPTFGKEPAPQSMYTLWGSPNIIDFLPGGGSSASSSSIGLNGAESCSSGGTTTSPEEFSSLEYEYSSPESFEILDTTNEYGRDAYNHQHHFNVRAGKFLSLKPIVNGFVSFTDRGAFKYYKKPTTVIARPAVISVSVRSSRQSVDSSRKSSEAAVADVAVDTGDDENTTPKSDYDTPFHFKPIQPAFKVRTDTPTTFERSESGTLWCNKQKLMTFKHESDDVSQPQRAKREPSSDLDSFQPKYVVNGNDVGCQTEWYGLSGFDSAMMAAHSSSSFFAPVNEKKNSQGPSYVPGAALFYAWDEVFNFLNKPGLGNIDVKAHLDFSCFF